MKETNLDKLGEKKSLSGSSKLNRYLVDEMRELWVELTMKGKVHASASSTGSREEIRGDKLFGETLIKVKKLPL